MAEKPQEKKSGVNRRVFVGQSVAAAGTMMALMNARALPAFAAEVDEGTIERMGRIAFDPETGKTWISLLHVDVTSREIDTEWGKTRVSEAVDHILLLPGGLDDRSGAKCVSIGLRHAKLDPRIAARNGRVAVTWCGMDHETHEWAVYVRMNDLREVYRGLHPEIALDPYSDRAYLVFEDWPDGSIRLGVFDGVEWSEPIRLSESGENYRPRVIVTRSEGKNKGAVAVAWDSYRDGQYDVKMRMVSADGETGPELRVTESEEWDNQASLAEDMEGNIWVAWVRASTELSNYDRLRVIHARFFDGEKWQWPLPPEDMPGGGRLTGQTSAMHPSLLVDQSNRVHLFYRDTEGTMWGVLYLITYENGKWSKRRKVRDEKIEDALNMIWEYSVALDDRNCALTVWDSLYVKRMAFASAVHPTFPLHLPPKPKSPSKTIGEEGGDTGRPGWPAREKHEPATMEIGGQHHMLLYGDTHSHSWTSDGIDPADWYYHYARDKARLDYYALSDHDFTICNVPGLEAYISFLPRHFNRPDFICFQAYEFSSQKTGHRVVVFEGYDKPTFSFAWPPKMQSATNDELYPFLRRFALTPDSRILVTAHNMVSIGNNFTGIDLGLEPLYDVTSLWTRADKPFKEVKEKGDAGNGGIWSVLGPILRAGKTPQQKALWNMCWRDSLDDGLMLGAYGNSDTHAANGIGFAVSGLWVEEKARGKIFDAMFARRAIAVDSALRLADCDITHKTVFAKKNDDMLRPDLRFWLDDNFMGANVSLSSSPTARVAASGHEPIRAAVIVKDGKDVHTAFAEGNEIDVEWRDGPFTPGRHYYYVRLEFKSGKSAFSSPVFVEFQD